MVLWTERKSKSRPCTVRRSFQNTETETDQRNRKCKRYKVSAAPQMFWQFVQQKETVPCADVEKLNAVKNTTFSGTKMDWIIRNLVTVMFSTVYLDTFWHFRLVHHAFSQFTCSPQTTEVFITQLWGVSKRSRGDHWRPSVSPSDSRAPSPYTAAGCCRARRSSRRRRAPGPPAGWWTCTWDRGSQTNPRCPRRPGWRSGRSRDRSRGGRRRGASDEPRRRCSTGSGAGRDPETRSPSRSCSPGCRPGWSSAWWETWSRRKQSDSHVITFYYSSEGNVVSYTDTKRQPEIWISADALAAWERDPIFIVFIWEERTPTRPPHHQ